MRNRIVSLILIAVMLVILFSGCSRLDSNAVFTTDATNETASTPTSDETGLSPETTATSSHTVTEPVVLTQGEWSLEDCQSVSNPAMYVLYTDGSLDKLHTGSILNWSEYPAPQYGAFSDNKNLIIYSDYDVQNPKINNGNKLVIFCTIDNNDYAETGCYAQINIAPVYAKGCTISRTNENGKWEALFFENNKNDGSLYCSRYWRAGRSMTSPENGGFDCTYINGKAVGDYPGIPLAEGAPYCNLQEGDTYKLGFVEGTALVEKEFTANANYYFQGENIEMELTPTADGYAIANLEDFTAGDYIVQIVWYDGHKLYCWCTHIAIE